MSEAIDSRVRPLARLRWVGAVSSEPVQESERDGGADVRIEEAPTFRERAGSTRTGRSTAHSDGGTIRIWCETLVGQRTRSSGESLLVDLFRERVACDCALPRARGAGGGGPGLLLCSGNALLRGYPPDLRLDWS